MGYDFTKEENGIPCLEKFVDRFVEKNFDKAYEIKVEGNKISSHRYRSWEYCRKAFIDAKTSKNLDDDTIDRLALQLAFYLASWGMYRGSSFLLSLDYIVHKEIVKILMKDCYKDLFDSDNLLSDKSYRKTYLNLLFGNEKKGESEIKGVAIEIQEYYKKWHKAVSLSPLEDIEEDSNKENLENTVSSVLVTKVLMGVYGCIPAYDRYVMDGLKTQGINASFGRSAVEELLNHTVENEAVRKNIEAVWNIIKSKTHCTQFDPNHYTFMKVVDMLFWEIGAGHIVEVTKNEKKFEDKDIGIIAEIERKILKFDKNIKGPYSYDIGGFTFESVDIGSLIMCVYEEFKDKIKNRPEKEAVKKRIKDELEPNWLATTRYSRRLVKSKRAVKS